MARIGVTYFDIEKAADAIHHNGKNPTVDRVLAHLGTGSKSTIGPLLKRWKTAKSDVADTAGLPDDLLKAVKSIHDRLQQVADDKIKQAQEKYQSLAGELQQKINSNELTIEQLQSNLQNSKASIESQRNDNNALRTDIENRRIKSAKVEVTLSNTENHLTDAKTTIQDQKNETTQIRAHFEHYQASVAEDRQQDREQFQTLKTQLENRIQELTLLAKEKDSRNQALELSLQKIEKALSSQRERHEQTKQDYQHSKLELTQKNNDAKQLSSEVVTLQKQVKNHEVTYASISAENRELKTANRVLEKDVSRLGQQASDAIDKIILLTDENRIVAEEKAIFQGQLKQIQSSL